MENVKTKGKNELLYYRLRFSYILVLFSFLMIRNITSLARLVPSKIDQVVFSGLAIAGIALIIYDFFTKKITFKARGNGIIVLFLLTMLVSIGVNFKYSLFSNLKILVWTAIQMMVLYTSYQDADEGRVKKEANIIGTVFSTIWFVLAIAGILMYFFQISYVVTFPNGMKRFQGFYEARLFGLSADPNYAAILSCIAAVFSIYRFKDTTHKGLKVFSIINVVTQYIFIVLSGSRTATIALGVILAFGLFVLAKNKANKKGFKKIVSVLLAGVIGLGVTVIVLMSFNYTQKGLEYVPSAINTLKPNNGSHEGEKIKPIIIERPDTGEGKDVSNNRFRIWKSGLTIFKHKPILGSTHNGMIAIGKEVDPNGMVATRNYLLHNGYLDVLVSTGVVGAAFIVALVVLIAIPLVKYLIKKSGSKHYSSVLTYLLVLLPIMVSACFLCEIFFMNTAGAFLFWTFLGYMNYYIDKYIKEDYPEKAEKQNITYKIACKLTSFIQVTK